MCPHPSPPVCERLLPWNFLTRTLHDMPQVTPYHYPAADGLGSCRQFSFSRLMVQHKRLARGFTPDSRLSTVVHPSTGSLSQGILRQTEHQLAGLAGWRGRATPLGCVVRSNSNQIGIRLTYFSRVAHTQPLHTSPLLSAPIGVDLRRALFRAMIFSCVSQPGVMETHARASPERR